MVLVSIIIPTYNRSHFLLETLESVKFQNHKNWECIVVDDGSTDDTEKIVNNYISKDERFKYVKRPAHLPKGACACRNYGFSLAQGDYIQWFDDDDIMFDNYLSDRIRLFSKNINFVIGTGFYADKSLMNRSMIPIKWEDNLFKSLATWRSHILTPSVIFRKDFLEFKDLFDPSIVRGQETDFFCRLFFGVQKNSYCITKSALFIYRLHDQSKSALGREYSPLVIQSKVKILVANLKRAKDQKDNELVLVLAKTLFNTYEKACENKDTANLKLSRRVLLTIQENKAKTFWFLIRVYQFSIFRRYFIKKSIINSLKKGIVSSKNF